MKLLGSDEPARRIKDVGGKSIDCIKYDAKKVAPPPPSAEGFMCQEIKCMLVNDEKLFREARRTRGNRWWSYLPLSSGVLPRTIRVMVGEYIALVRMPEEVCLPIAAGTKTLPLP